MKLSPEDHEKVHRLYAEHRAHEEVQGYEDDTPEPMSLRERRQMRATVMSMVLLLIWACVLGAAVLLSV